MGVVHLQSGDHCRCRPIQGLDFGPLRPVAFQDLPEVLGLLRKSYRSRDSVETDNSVRKSS